MAQIRLLLWLKFKLTMRQVTGSVTSLVGTIIAVCLLAPLSVALGVGGYFAASKPPEEVRSNIIMLAFFFVYVIWLVTPLFGFKSQFYDITKLFLYPLSHRKVLVACVIGGCLSLPTLFFLTGFLGMALGISLNPLEVACRLILFSLFLFHSISLGELILLSSLNFLKSRVFKDIATILGPFIGVALYFTFRFGIPRLFQDGLMDSKLLGLLRYQPSYWIALPFSRLWHGDLLDLLPFMLGFAPLTVVIVLACAKLQERAFFADHREPSKVVSSSASAAADESGRYKEPFGASLMNRVLGDEVVAIAGKEAAMIRREPVFKTLLLQQLFFLIIPVLLPFLLAHKKVDGISKVFSHIPLFVAAFLLMQEGFILQNVLGLEGRGINLTFSLPMKRWKLFFGKNLCYLALFSIVNVVFITILSAVYKRMEMLPLYLVFQEILLIAIIGLGNPISIYVPMRLTVRGSNVLKLHHRRRMTFAQSIISAITRSAMLAIISPMILLMFLPKLIGFTWLYVPSIALCALYAGGVYFGALKLSEFLLTTREEKLLGYFLGDDDWV